MQDTNLKCGQEIKRPGGQLVGCGILACDWNLEFQCYCRELHIGQIKGIVAPVCLSYVGILLAED